MADLGSTSYSETDASNNATPPNGWPEGMNPSDANNSARANMGGEKRFWNRTNSVFTTAGTTTAYTLTYGVAAAAYYDGEEFSFVVNATCGAAPTLNINALGARSIRKFFGGAFIALVAGDLQANQPVRVRYNLAATSFDIVMIAGAVADTYIIAKTVSAGTDINWQSIPTSLNHLEIIFDFTPATNNVGLIMQFYNSAGVLDTGAAAYTYMQYGFNTDATSGASGGSSTAIVLATAVSNNASFGCSGDIVIPDIQAAKATQSNWRANWLNQAGAIGSSVTGGGWRAANGNITGVKISAASGNVTGRATLKGWV